MSDSDTKIIEQPIIVEKTNKVTRIRKSPKKRVITTTKKWKIDQINLSQQLDYIGDPLVAQQIRQKISGYRCQDVKKKLFNSDLFITYDYVLEIMKNCENKCYYCNNTTNLLYENVRDPKQWTLERIENDQGHNIGNVVIACLECNLRRRTLYHERYLFTKQLNIVKVS